MSRYALMNCATSTRHVNESVFHHPAKAVGHSRARVASLLFMALLCTGYSGCRREPSTPPMSAANQGAQPPGAGAASQSPANAPSPFPLPPPKPMTAAVVKKYFLFPADKPMIPYTRPGPFAGGFFVDPGSGKLAWKAMVCTALDCPGRKPGKDPEPFAIRHAYLFPQPNGETPNLFDDGKGPQACPHCGRSQTIKEYLSPEDESRKARLAAELQQAYTLRSAARAAGRQAADGVRTPQEVMDEINSIPRHYLLDKDMDYAPLEAAAQSPQLPGE